LVWVSLLYAAGEGERPEVVRQNHWLVSSVVLSFAHSLGGDLRSPGGTRRDLQTVQETSLRQSPVKGMKKAILIVLAALAGIAGLFMLTAGFQFAEGVPPDQAGRTIMFYRAAGVLWLVIATVCLRSAFRSTRATTFDKLKSGTPRDRLEAVEDLARLATRRVPGAFEALDRATVDSDDHVRRAAVLAVDNLQRMLGALPLTPISDHGRLRDLTRRLLSSDAYEQRVTASEIRELGDPWLYQAVIQLRIAGRDDAAARARALRALGYLGDSLAIDYLQVALADADQSVQAEAQAALNRIRTGAMPGESVISWVDN
jgi:hypothetical protein